MTDSSIDIEEVMSRAEQAAAVFSQLDQSQTDSIVRAVYEAGLNARVLLARLAHEETGLGKWKDKVIKNVAATQYVYEDIRDLPTVGVISRDEAGGVTEIAQPLGPILAVIPVTNPTSTALFKILISLKTRNPIVIRPHRRAVGCTRRAAEICYQAALEADAPEDCIQWVGHTSREETGRLMSHPHLALILATGGPGLVKAAYSSGTPAIGVGAGNVPVFIEQTADIPFAVDQIFLSKTFDNGTVCASEQALVVEQLQRNEVVRAILRQGGYMLSEKEIGLLEGIALDRTRGVMNLDIVGQPAKAIAEMAGFRVPSGTRVLIAPLEGVGPEYPLSSEILAPILAFYTARGFEDAVKTCIDLNFHGGMGHTASIFSNDRGKIEEFASLMNAGRVVVNTPSSQGAVGGIFNTLHPSLTLGCGTGGKNITTDNITASHLLNVQRIARRRVNERVARFKPERYLDETLDAEALEREFNRNY